MGVSGQEGSMKFERKQWSHLILENNTCWQWTRKEKQAVHKQLENFIRRGIVPGKS